MGEFMLIGVCVFAVGFGLSETIGALRTPGCSTPARGVAKTDTGGVKITPEDIETAREGKEIGGGIGPNKGTMAGPFDGEIID